MAANWEFEGWVYNDRDGNMVGPLSTDELRRAIGKGELSHTDRVWTKWRGRNELLLPTWARRAYQEATPTPPS